MAKAIHVVPEGDSWAVEREGESVPLYRCEAQADAIDYGREVARRDGAELVIHDEQGRIRAKDSHGNDPYPPRG